MKRLLIAIAVLCAAPAFADRDHDQDRWDDKDAIILHQEDVNDELDDLDRLIDQIASESRPKQRNRLVQKARQEMDVIRRMVKEAPAVRERWRQWDKDRDRDRDRYSDRDNDRWDDRQPPAQQQPPPPNTQQPPPPTGGPVVVKPPPGQGTPPPPPPQNLVYPMQAQALEQLKAAIRRESFPRDQLRVLSSAAPANWFITDQVQQLLSLYSFPRDRLEAARVLKPRILDTENYFRLYASFEFPADKAELKRILGQ